MPISYSYQQILSKIHYDIERARCYVDSFPCSWMFWGVFGCFEVYSDVLGCFWMFWDVSTWSPPEQAPLYSFGMFQVEYIQQ